MPSRPLVVLTRESADNAPLREALEARGVAVRELPCVSTAWLAPVHLPTDVAAVAFASRRGVQGLLRLPGGREWLEALPCGTVGPRTTAEVEAAGLSATWEADPPVGEHLGRIMHRSLPEGAVIASVRGAVKGGSLEPTLAALGRRYETVVVYENPAPDIPEVEPFPVSAVFAASPSAIRRLLVACPWMLAAPFVAMGPTTRRQCEALGATVVAETGPDLREQTEILARISQESRP